MRNANYRKNKAVSVPKGKLNGQSLPPLAGMRFGISTVGKAGCGAVAVYNAALAAGKETTLAEVIRELEGYALAFLGTRGSYAYLFWIYFRKHRIPLRMTFSRKRTEESAYALAAYWTKRPFFSSAHIVYLERTASGIRVYNRYGNRAVPYELSDLCALTGRGRFFLGYRLK